MCISWRPLNWHFSTNGNDTYLEMMKTIMNSDLDFPDELFETVSNSSSGKSRSAFMMFCRVSRSVSPP